MAIGDMMPKPGEGPMKNDSVLPITGGCLCKAVRYSCAGQPLAARTCWCRLCQYIGAGNATVNICFKSADVTVMGALGDYAGVADSGNRMHRRFCKVCGVHLFSAAESRPHLLFIRVGTLDDPDIGAPQATIWASAAPAWACVNETIPKHEGQPPPVV